MISRPLPLLTIPQNEQKITDDLFAVAGRSTFIPTRRSRDWEHMALPRVPDFSAFAEEDLFDEKEDMHFLTEKSPWKGAAGLKAEGIPEGHEVGGSVLGFDIFCGINN